MRFVVWIGGALSLAVACSAPPVPSVPQETARVSPEADIDRDGLIGEEDRCPGQAEDFDGIEDADGCPERDADRDLVLDEEDQCPEHRGSVFAEEWGCPWVAEPPTGCATWVVHREIRFEVDRDEIDDREAAVIDLVVRDVRGLGGAGSGLALVVSGHREVFETVDLGLRRAEAVRDQLAKRGLDPAWVEVENRGPWDRAECHQEMASERRGRSAGAPWGCLPGLLSGPHKSEVSLPSQGHKSDAGIAFDPGGAPNSMAGASNGGALNNGGVSDGDPLDRAVANAGGASNRGADDSSTSAVSPPNRRVSLRVVRDCSNDPPRYPFQAPLPSRTLPRDAPAIRYANLSPAECRAELKRRELPVQRDRRPTPGVATGVRFTGPLNGIAIVAPGRRTPYGVLDCRLALTLDDMTRTLAEYGVVRIRIDNFYRRGAKLPARRRRNSQHAHGLATDITALYLADRELNVQRDWQGDLGDPPCGPNATLTEPTENAILIRTIACELGRQGQFHTMLTPCYDVAHRNHFHFDIKRGKDRWNIH